MTCPICRGETDPAKRVLETLCDAHLAEVKPLSEEEIEKAVEEGQRAYRAAIGTCRLVGSTADMLRGTRELTTMSYECVRCGTRMRHTISRCGEMENRRGHADGRLIKATPLRKKTSG